MKDFVDKYETEAMRVLSDMQWDCLDDSHIEGDTQSVLEAMGVVGVAVASEIVDILLNHQEKVKEFMYEGKLSAERAMREGVTCDYIIGDITKKYGYVDKKYRKYSF